MLSRRGIFGLFAGAAAIAPATVKALGDIVGDGCASSEFGALSAISANFGNYAPHQRWSLALNARGDVIGLVQLDSGEPSTSISSSADTLSVNGEVVSRGCA